MRIAAFSEIYLSEQRRLSTNGRGSICGSATHSRSPTMAQTRKIAVVVGSLRKESFSRKLAKAIAAVAPANLAFDFLDIGQLQHFNQDLEATP
ncbi:NAD(P)H-dependent oxidoreductase, partial [Phenylobacterium sp.]|uniref:NAD(P)H-dependent oxidoreductase n=1 Tax=Phenylobacterium sp. TaxID=1871053 RepID=UPI0039C9E494